MVTVNVSTNVFAGSFGVEVICFLKQSFSQRSPQTKERFTAQLFGFIHIKYDGTDQLLR